MSRRGRKRKIINTAWSPELAYVVGLIATDGYLSSDKRHISFTSKDKAQVFLFKKLLKLSNVIGRKGREREREKKYYVVQFGSVQFYSFLLSIGLSNKKSKTIKSLAIPDEYFWDFLRGCLDGDGNINEFSHPESSHTQLRVRFCSASKEFLVWKLKTIRRLSPSCKGWLSTVPYKTTLTLSFGKKDSVTLLNLMYKNTKFYLHRKYAIAKKYIIQ